MTLERVDDSDRTGRFISQMTTAIDACLDDIPSPSEPVDVTTWPETCRAAHPGSSDDATSLCVAAEKAVRDIEAMCEYEGESVGLGGEPGDTHVAMLRVLADQPNLLRHLQHLARSKSPVSHLAAIDGFAKTGGPVAVRELERLAKDKRAVTAVAGCIGEPWRVSDHAKEVLRDLRRAARGAVTE